VFYQNEAQTPQKAEVTSQNGEPPHPTLSPSGEGMRGGHKRRRMSLFFGEVPVGTAFAFRGGQYLKIALGMAAGEDRCANIFMGETVVEVEGELKERLPWKPDEVYWADRLSPAPGQKDG
jgi:hypothetical protein